MQKLAEICIKRPVFATMIGLAMIVIGGFAYLKLGVDLFPKVEFPTITITTVVQGASPEEIESQVTKKIEEAVNTIEGIDELRSVSAEGVSQVFITFVLERNGDEAASDVRDRVNRILRDLPEDADPPVIEKLDVDAAPVMSVAVSGKRSLREITEIVDKQVKQNIESMSGVGQVRFIGDRKREIQIVLDPNKLRAYNLTVDQVRQGIASQNIEIPGGRLEQGANEMTLRTMGRVERVEDFNNIIVANVGSAPVRVRDIAYVEDGVEEPRTIARLDGEQAVVLEIRKQSGTNTVQVVDSVKQRLAEIKKNLPPDFNVQVVRDQSTFIKGSFHAIQEHLLMGALFAALVVLVFIRNFRATIISSIAIPTSIIATYALMWYLNLTLNNITMLALVLCVGIVIDDAIVVLENIYHFIEEKGMSPIAAAIAGTKDVGLAVMATTFSLIIIFLPLAFMTGIVGRFMAGFGWTAAFAIAVSLFVSFTITPMLASRFIRKKEGKHSSKESKLYRYIDGPYTAMLKWSMAHRKTIVLAAFLVTISSFWLFQWIGKDFLPQDDQAQMEVTLRLPEGASLDTTDKVVRELSERMKNDFPQGVVGHILTSVGADQQQRVNRASIFFDLVPMEERSVSQQQLIAAARNWFQSNPEYLPYHPAVQVPGAISGGGFVNADVVFVIRGPEIAKLKEYSNKVVEILRNTPGAVDTDTTLEEGKPEVRVNINRDKASDLGVSVGSIAGALRTMVGGQVISSYKEGDDRYDVRLRVDEKYRADASGVAQLYVPSLKAGNVRLDNVVSLSEGTGPAQIDRYNRQRQVVISTNVARGHSASEVMAGLMKQLPSVQMDHGYEAEFSGRSREMGRAAGAFLMAFGLSLILMYMILAAQFESFIHPVTILLSLPLSIPFAIISLFATGQNFSIIYSSIGVLVLFGIVKKNSILQIDHANNLRRREGMPRYDAIIQACRDRMRPILMTTFALVAGMIPMAFGTGPGSGSRRSVAIMIIGGQTLCLLLTLLVTPVAYSIFDDWANSTVWGRIARGARMPFAWARRKLASATSTFLSLFR
ncbi:MAG TPA: efflux RND transporter permease subunit [Blastocatellia bacterium]|nr:efflux RND transporter permease subunit [Blastocatellia bacterium]